MTTKPFDAYILDGEEGKAIKLWTFECNDALEALEFAKEDLRKLGGPPIEGLRCLQIVKHDDPPMDVLSWRNRRCLPLPSDQDGLGAVRFEAAGKLGNAEVKRIVYQAVTEESRKLAAIAKEQEFGLDGCNEAVTRVPYGPRIKPDQRNRLTLDEIIDKIPDEQDS